METTDKIAIIGAAVRFPGSRTLARFWQNLAGAQISVREGPPHADDPAFVPRFGSIEGRDDFDYAFFGINLREAEFIDPQQRLLLECGWALREALGPGGLAGRVTGVFVGTSISTYLHNALRRPLVLNGEEGFQAMLGCDKDLAASRLSYKLGFTGPSLVVQTACSTSLVAVHLARLSLLRGECEIALAGGVSVKPLEVGGYLYQEGGIN
ncbi:MAG TPA: polyketide synthase, partial [Polyangiaceae bacterium]|nr:polyketide synthase [Polyangiaceae bacterium]